VSDSVEEILGYLPDEVIGKSCWDYFHPQEIPFAKASHGRGIELDKAAALFYCKVKQKSGAFVSCECVFTVVYDVLVASTSIYRRGARSLRRSLQVTFHRLANSRLERQKEAPMVQRLFSSSPRDPRYHMLSYISSKFSEAPTSASHEPRAALFLNRFTRTSTIMYATDSVSSILGVRADQLLNKSFYFCIAEDCLQDAVRCLESAKSNDSIAYLRFWFRNPLLEERNRAAARDHSQSSDEDEDEGGVRLQRPDQAPAYSDTPMNTARPRSHTDETDESSSLATDDVNKSRSTSGNSTDLSAHAQDAIFDEPTTTRSSTSSMTPMEDIPLYVDPVEVEAVVSCTSDGLVVIVRQARPSLAQFYGPEPPVDFENSLFASPWAMPASEPGAPPEAQVVDEGRPVAASVAATVSASSTGPQTSTVMNAIREVAVFAWSLTGINGSLIQHGRGQPDGEALPPDGLPVWDPYSDHSENDRFNGFADNSHRRATSEFNEASSSEDEIVFKRVKVMPEWKKPSKRAHPSAFKQEDKSREAENGLAPARKRKMDR
jgi:PAS fold